MTIKFINRKQIINNYLDKVLNGYILTEEDRSFLNDMSNALN